MSQSAVQQCAKFLSQQSGRALQCPNQEAPAECVNVPDNRIQQREGGGGQTGATEKEKTNQQKALPIPPTPPLPRTNGTDLVDAPA